MIQACHGTTRNKDGVSLCFSSAETVSGHDPLNTEQVVACRVHDNYGRPIAINARPFFDRGYRLRDENLDICMKSSVSITELGGHFGLLTLCGKVSLNRTNTVSCVLPTIVIHIEHPDDGGWIYDRKSRRFVKIMEDYLPAWRFYSSFHGLKRSRGRKTLYVTGPIALDSMFDGLKY